MLRLAQSTAALLIMGPGSGAGAADYDMDCKVILCLPAGFPRGCGEALNHMVDRLRDGKAPLASTQVPRGRRALGALVWRRCRCSVRT